MNGFFNWLKTNWFFVLAILLVLPLVYRYLKDQIQLNKLQNEEIKGENQLVDNVNPIVRTQNANQITLDKGVQNAAADLAHHLGVKYSDAGHWYDFLNPRGWTENDAEVLRILKYQVRNYHLVERLYYEVYTKRRNLKDDVNKLLDSKELSELKNYYKQYNKVW
ncbi:hypothetical protein [Flavobacterium sp. UMI-01]|uniref:hypothetical protein n=1 Tax=Flavobacterium sp. UMI-01 TaxID=1441053 RepID=UPI001C7D501B|nr:hypothetical protein [Flavobacterium sp. UMI-01]